VLWVVTAPSISTPDCSDAAGEHHHPKHDQAADQPVFSTKAVHQQLYKRYWACVPRGACGPVSKWIATNRYETGYASNFAFANFRHVVVR
jgi:hypothetical protein